MEPGDNVATEKPTITLSLLVDVKNLLDVAVSRGAYKPEELTPVGKVYDMYKECLESLKENPKPE